VLAHGKRVTPEIQRSVSGPGSTDESVVGGARTPAVDREVVQRLVRIAEEKSLDVSVRLAEETRPVAVGAVEGLECRNLLGPDLVLPDDRVYGGSPPRRYVSKISHQEYASPN
jgi:hypothetical protein